VLDAKGWPKDEVEVSAAKIKEGFTTAEAVAASVGTSSIHGFALVRDNWVRTLDDGVRAKRAKQKVRLRDPRGDGQGVR
jgi:hypothetical protein